MGYSQAELEALMARGPVEEKPLLSREEAEQMARAEWVSILSSLWIAVGKPVDDRRLAVYTQNLSSVPLGLLQAAVTRALRDASNYNLVPTIGALWDALRKELHNPRDLDAAIERWCAERYERIIYRFEGGRSQEK